MHRFAAAFLVPAEHLRGQVGGDRRGFTYGEIVRLKHVYGIAASAMLLRLRDVGILSPQYVSRAFRTYARTWRKDEPDPIAENEGLGAFEKPQRFESLVGAGSASSCSRRSGARSCSSARFMKSKKQSEGQAPRDLLGRC